MKHLLLSAIILAGVSMATSTDVLADCARQTAYHLKYITDSIEKDLVSSAWVTDLLGMGSEVYFHTDGTVESIQQDDVSVVRFMQWDVTMVDGIAILTISAADGSSRSLHISPTCDGFAASDAFGVETEIMMQAREKSDQINLTRNQMTGSWKSQSKKQAWMRDMQWDLKHDGTFTLAVAPDMYHAAHQGVWDVTSDGQYLLLYFTRTNNPETVYRTEIVRIKSVDFEDLVLDVQDLSAVVGYGNTKHAVRDFVKDFSM